MQVCNAATKTTSTMRCYICGATSKDFNNLKLTKKIELDSLIFGLSVLHARIRMFGSLLHLSYKPPIKKWVVQSESDKEVVRQRKHKIQVDFRKKLGLIIDVPKPGLGNTNDGNMSRRFFKNPLIASKILGIDERRIYQYKVIIETIFAVIKLTPVNIF